MVLLLLDDLVNDGLVAAAQQVPDVPLERQLVPLEPHGQVYCFPVRSPPADALVRVGEEHYVACYHPSEAPF